MARKPAQPAPGLTPGMTASRTVDVRGFQQILDDYAARGKEALRGVTLYVWRSFPQIDARLTNRKVTNVLTLKCVDQDNALTELPKDITQYITQALGGGKYRLSLNDTLAPDDSTDARSQVAQCTLRVSDVEFEPILDPAELVPADPETNNWIQRQMQLGRLVKTAQGGFARANDPSAPRAGGDPAVEVLARMAERNNGAAQDQTAVTTGVFGLVNTLVGRMLDQQKAPVPAAPGSEILPLLFQAYLNSTQQNHELLLKLTAQQHAAPAAPAPASWEQELERFQKLRTLFAGEGGARRAGGTDWVELLKPVVPLLATVATGILGRNGVPAATPAATLPPPADQQAADASARDAQQFEQWKAGFCIMADKALAQEREGSDVATGLEMAYQEASYDRMAGLGKEALFQLLQASPVSQARVAAAPAAAATLVEQFIAYGQDDPEPAAAAPPPAAASAAQTGGMSV